MQCVILAAGEGSRMRPLTSTRPKVMIPVGGKPMLERLVENLREAGIRDIVMVIGYMEQTVREWFGNGSKFGVSIRYVVQRRQLGTGNALLVAEPFVTDKFIMLNGDMILEVFDIQKLARMKAPVMSVSTTDHPENFGVVTVSRGKITSLEEKSENPKSDIINAGAYLFETDIFDVLKSIKPSKRGEYELTDALMNYIDDKKLSVYNLSLWLDVGYPWDILTAAENILKNIEDIRLGTIEENVVIHGRIMLGKGSKIMSGTYIEGPCIIGENTVVGPNAYIRPGSVIGNDCHIGHAVEIKNSTVFDNTKIPHYNYIGDSIIGSGCNFGAGTKIANLRHDKGIVSVGGISTGRKKFGAVIGDNVLFGINCSINTGSSVGSGSRIGPHSLVYGKLENNTVVK